MAMKQNNFYLRWQKAAGAAKTESRSKDLRTVVPGIAVVVLVGACNMLGDCLRDALDPKAVRQ